MGCGGTSTLTSSARAANGLVFTQNPVSFAAVAHVHPDLTGTDFMITSTGDRGDSAGPADL